MNHKKLIRVYSNGIYQTTDWIPGINLVTYKVLNGIYPTKEMVIIQLKAFKGFKHRDFHIGNLIIQGTNLVAIDGDDLRVDGDHPETAYPRLVDGRLEKIIKQLHGPTHELLKKFATPKKSSNLIYLSNKQGFLNRVGPRIFLHGGTLLTPFLTKRLNSTSAYNAFKTCLWR